MKGIPRRFLILGLVLEALLLLLLYAASSDQIVTAIVIMLSAGAVFLIAAYFVNLQTQDTKALFRFIIASAIVYRLTIWPLAFPSTDDVYRYRWEGKLQSFDGNPYEARPSDEKWAFLRDSTYARVGLKDFKGGYGPAWELVANITYRIVSAHVVNAFAQAFWFKAPAALADLALIAATAALLRARGVPAVRVLIYAWSPLPVWEFWANGHNDALAVLATTLAILWSTRHRPWQAAGALGVATALKLWPAILVAAIARGGLRIRHLAVGVLLFALFALPYWTAVTENIQFMSGFVGGWRNNDSFFGVILWAMRNQYRAKYTAFLLIGAFTLLIAVRCRDIVQACLWTLVTLLLVASNCHPWYLTWFLPLLALYPSAGLLLWTAAVPMFYSVWPGWVATGIWDGVTPTRWLVYAPVFALIVGRNIYDWRFGPRQG